MNSASEMFDDLKKWLEEEVTSFKNAPFFLLRSADEQAETIRNLFNAKATVVEESIQQAGDAALMEAFRKFLADVDVLWQDMIAYNKYRSKWSVTAGWSKSDTSKCTCGGSFDGVNCAHYLSQWLIESDRCELAFPVDTVCCPTGRPIRAKEMRKMFSDLIEPERVPESGAFVYCENSNGRGHVYFGTRSTCIHGTASAEAIGYTALVAYYREVKSQPGLAWRFKFRSAGETLLH